MGHPIPLWRVSELDICAAEWERRVDDERPHVCVSVPLVHMVDPEREPCDLPRASLCGLE